MKKDCKAGNVGNKANGSGTKDSVDGSSNSLKGQNMFNKSLQIASSSGRMSHLIVHYFHMGNESTTMVHGHGCVDLRLNIVSDNIGSAFMSTSKLECFILGMLVDGDNPKTFDEAMKSQDVAVWKETINDEMDSKKFPWEANIGCGLI
ncbi:hypothetical protein Tco_0554670 [Tanacetum coccineum]